VGVVEGMRAHFCMTREFMPPIASKIPDGAGADLLAKWIDGIAVCP